MIAEMLTRAEAASRRQAHQEPLPPRAAEVLDGELLGDGNLGTRRAGTAYAARYQHNARDRAYLEWLADELGLDCTVTGPHTNAVGAYHFLRSASYAALLPFYDRWYDESLPARHRKVVPTDLRLTPVVALHWYLGDGCLAVDRRTPGTRPVCRFSTDGYVESDVRRLAGLLAPFRPRIHRFGTRHRIVVDSEPFLDWIGPCPIPDVHGHKWSGKPAPGQDA